MKNASSEDFVVENALPETTWHLAGGFFFLRKDPNSWLTSWKIHENPIWMAVENDLENPIWMDNDLADLDRFGSWKNRDTLW